MNRVSGGDDSSDDRQIPEDDGNVALLLSLRSDPLHDKPRAEDELAEESEGEPELVERHDSCFTL